MNTFDSGKHWRIPVIPEGADGNVETYKHREGDEPHALMARTLIVPALEQLLEKDTTIALVPWPDRIVMPELTDH